MKIGIIARTWFTSTKGGSERYIARLFEELKKNHEVRAVTLDKSKDKDVIQIRLPKISLVTQALFSVWASIYMNKFKPDVCLVNQYWGEFSALLLKVRWVPIIHDIGLFYSKWAKKSYFKHFVRTNVLKKMAKRAELIIVPSRLTANDLQAYLKVPKEKIKIVPEGVDLNKFRPSHVKHKGINLVCAGRIAPNKGHDILLLAFRAVKEKYPDSRLYLVGGVLGNQKDYYNKLKRLAKTLSLDDVVFTGYVSDEDLVRYYNLADIYAQPSVGEEGWGMSIAEAFACRKPVICSDIFYETGVADRDRALIVRVGDPEGLAEGIEALIEDGELRKKIAENGYKFAQKLSWKRMTDEILQAVKNLVGD